MQAKGFFASLFDYSFSSYITPRIIKVLYVLETVIVALWTLVIILLAFKTSSALGIVALIGGPIYFVIAMIFARVGLEYLSAFFHIHEDVQRINERAGGSPVTSAPPPTEPAAEPTEAAPVLVSSSAPRPAPVPHAATRFCENCGTER